MPVTDRRSVMQTAVAVPIAMAATGPAFPQTTEAAPGADANRAPAEGVTRALARYVDEIRRLAEHECGGLCEKYLRGVTWHPAYWPKCSRARGSRSFTGAARGPT